MAEKPNKRKTFPVSETASGIDVTGDQHGDAYALSARRGADTILTVSIDTKAIPALASGRMILSIGGVRDGEDVTAMQIDIRNAGAVSGTDVAAAIEKVLDRIMRSAMKRISPDVGEAIAAQRVNVAQLVSTVSSAGA